MEFINEGAIVGAIGPIRIDLEVPVGGILRHVRREFGIVQGIVI